MGVKSTFLYGDLHEEIYMEQPLCFIQTNSGLVCSLKKSLYGLKQAPRDWYAKMDSFLLDTGFSRCHSNNIVYTKKVGKSLIIIVIYVDDLILTGSAPNLINHVKSSLQKQFEMTSLGHLHYFLGIQVLKSKEDISLSQSKYACDILRHFHMEVYKSTTSPFQSVAKISVTSTSPEVDATLYHQLVGKLFYLTHTRPDLSLLALLLGLCKTHMKVIGKQLKEYFIMFEKSTVGYVFTLGFGPIAWACKKQSAISLSSIEAEYCGIVEDSKEALWLRQILLEFGFQGSIRLHSGVIIKVSFNYAKIPSNINATNTLNYTCTSL
eukprot:PITA_13109